MNYTIKLKRKPKNELYHHGIHGQRWGVRNGPPYPLDSRTSARVKKGEQAKLRLTDKEYQKKREDLKKGKVDKDETSGSPHMLDKQPSTIINIDGNYEKKSYGITDPNYTPKEDLALILKKNPNAYTQTTDAFTSGSDDDARLERLRKSDIHGFFEETGFTINPGGPNGITFHPEEERCNNCLKCSAGAALKLKGYNIHAGNSTNGGLNSSLSYWFDGAVQYKEKGAENTFNRMKKGNRNSYGEINFRYPDGSGHSIFYYNDRNNNLYLRDEQCAREFKIDDMNSLYDVGHNTYGFDLDKFSNITRLDTATPNFDHMAEDHVIMDYHNTEYFYDEDN